MKFIAIGAREAGLSTMRSLREIFVDYIYKVGSKGVTLHRLLFLCLLFRAA